MEISDDFGAFWRYLEQAPQMTIEIDYQYIGELESIDTQDMVSIDSKAHRKPVWSQST